jgi:acetylornithine deacetylase/succinyl-diaminopimelate desuccinylase-like protein
MKIAAFFLSYFLISTGVFAQATPDWLAVNRESLGHFQTLVRMDTTNPPGNETTAVTYLKKTLDDAGIATKILAAEPGRANLVARIPGNGTKKPLLVMAHTDTVTIDKSKWTHGPFSADLADRYVYGRGTLDDKDSVTASLETALLLKRGNVALDRDVIFLFEAGEEASTKIGIDFVVGNHWEEIDAEVCLAETGGVQMENGKPRYATIQTAEKLPNSLKLVARGPAGHGSVPTESNAVVHLAQAIGKVAAWRPPMRLTDTTRTYFERLAGISTPEQAARYNGLLDPMKSNAVQTYLASREPSHNSMLRTSITPTILQGGYQVNVIPSEVQATLDVRSVPGEDMDRFAEMVRDVINDPQVEVVRENRNARPAAPASSLTAGGVFQTLEQVVKKVYNVPVLPVMSTGATDMAFVRAKGTQCYGIGPATDAEDGPLGFGAHSDQERIRESSLYDFVRFNYEAVTALAGKKK